MHLQAAASAMSRLLTDAFRLILFPFSSAVGHSSDKTLTPWASRQQLAAVKHVHNFVAVVYP